MKSMFTKALVLTLAMVPALVIASDHELQVETPMRLTAIAKHNKAIREARQKAVEAAEEAAKAQRVVPTANTIANEQDLLHAQLDAEQAAARRTLKKRARRLVSADWEIDEYQLNADERAAVQAALEERQAYEAQSRFQRFKGFVTRNVSRAYNRVKGCVTAAGNYAWNNKKDAAIYTAAGLVAGYFAVKATKAIYKKAKSALGYSTKTSKKSKKLGKKKLRRA